MNCFNNQPSHQELQQNNSSSDIETKNQVQLQSNQNMISGSSLAHTNTNPFQSCGTFNQTTGKFGPALQPNNMANKGQQENQNMFGQMNQSFSKDFTNSSKLNQNMGSQGDSQRTSQPDNSSRSIQDQAYQFSLVQHEEQRKQLFQDSAAQLMNLYKESIKKCEESYLQGKEDAFEEVLKWFLSFNNGDFKHISTYEFFNFITQKLQDQRNGKSKKQSAAQSLSKLFVGQSTNQNLQSTSISQNIQNSSVDQSLLQAMSSKEQILEILAQQTEQEAYSEKFSIQKKINFNLNAIKLQDSKKRRRPGENYNDYAQSCQSFLQQQNKWSSSSNQNNSLISNQGSSLQNMNSNQARGPSQQQQQQQSFQLSQAQRLVSNLNLNNSQNQQQQKSSQNQNYNNNPFYEQDHLAREFHGFNKIRQNFRISEKQSQFININQPSSQRQNQNENQNQQVSRAFTNSNPFGMNTSQSDNLQHQNQSQNQNQYPDQSLYQQDQQQQQI
eukprot:403334454